jgi:hypothetical protein
VDRFPCNLWTLPNVVMLLPKDLEKFYNEVPQDFIGADFNFGVSKNSVGIPYESGEYTDEFGLVWRCAGNPYENIKAVFEQWNLK